MIELQLDILLVGNKFKMIILYICTKLDKLHFNMFVSLSTDQNVQNASRSLFRNL